MNGMTAQLHRIKSELNQPAKPTRATRTSLAYWWPRLTKRDGERCWYCWRGLRPPPVSDPHADDAPTVEHLLAQTKGGTWSEANLVIACRRCNHAMDAKPIIEKVAYRDEQLALRLIRLAREA